jgi:hypothetical protein
MSIASSQGYLTTETIVSFSKVSRTDELSSQWPIGLRRTVRRCKKAAGRSVGRVPRAACYPSGYYYLYVVWRRMWNNGFIEGCVVLTE